MGVTEYWSGGVMGKPRLPEQKADFFPDAPPEPPFHFEPDAQHPISEEPGEGCRGADPLVIGLKVRLKSSDLKGVAKLSLKDRLNAHSVPRLNENGDGLHGQEIAHSRD